MKLSQTQRGQIVQLEDGTRCVVVDPKEHLFFPLFGDEVMWIPADVKVISTAQLNWPQD
jgi:hypothetical protein